MNIEEIEKFDPQKMYQVYDKWAILARDAYEKEFTKIKFENIDGSRLANVEFPLIVDKVISSENTYKKLPEWVNNNAGWWADGQIDDKSFATGIEFLIKIGLIVV